VSSGPAAPPYPGSGPARRVVLGAAAAALPLLLTACRGVQVLGMPPPPPADVQALKAAISAEQLMVAHYRAAVAMPAVAGTGALAALSAVLAEHEQHLAQLQSRLVEPATGPSPSPSAATPAPGLPPGGLTGTLRFLEDAEQSASDRLINYLPVVPPTLAQLFASIAASEATHAPFLRAAAHAPPSGTASPSTTSPSTTSSGTASLGTASPGTASPGTASPSTTSPSTASPGTASPGTASPGTASPGTASPGTSGGPH
jgi:hypothetical protein